MCTKVFVPVFKICLEVAPKSDREFHKMAALFTAKAERHSGVHSEGRKNLHLSHVTTARTDISTSNLSPAELVWTWYCSQPFCSSLFCNSPTLLLYPSSNRQKIFTGTILKLSVTVKVTNWDRNSDPNSAYEVTFTGGWQCIWRTAQSG